MSLGTSIKLCRAFVMCACLFTRCFVLEGAPGRKLLLYLWGYFQRWRRSGAKPMRAHYHFPEPHTQELGMVWLERMKQFLCWTISPAGKKLDSVHLAFTYQALWMGWLLYTLCTYGGQKEELSNVWGRIPASVYRLGMWSPWNLALFGKVGTFLPSLPQ
jgi:hypothetical protein